MIGFLFRWVLLVLLFFAAAHSSNAWFVDTLGGELLGVTIIALGGASLRSILRKTAQWSKVKLELYSAGTIFILGAGVLKLLPNWEISSVRGLFLAYVVSVLATIGINAWIEDR